MNKKEQEFRFDKDKYLERCKEVYKEIRNLIKDFNDVHIFYFFSPSLYIKHSLPGLFLTNFLLKTLNDAQKNATLYIFGVFTKEVEEKYGAKLKDILDALEKAKNEMPIIDNVSKILNCLSETQNVSAKDTSTQKTLDNEIYCYKTVLKPQSFDSQLFAYDLTKIRKEMFQSIYYKYLKQKIRDIFKKKKDNSKMKIIFIVDVSSGLQSIITTLLIIVSNIFMNFLRVKLGLVESLRSVELLVIDSNKKQTQGTCGLVTIEELTKFSIVNLKNSIFSPTEILDAIGIGNYALAQKLADVFIDFYKKTTVHSERLEGFLDILKTIATFYKSTLDSISLHVEDKNSQMGHKKSHASMNSLLDINKLKSFIDSKIIRIGNERKQFSEGHAKMISNILGSLIKQFDKFCDAYTDFMENRTDLMPSQGYLYYLIRKKMEDNASNLRMVLSYLTYLYYAFFVDSTIRLARGEFDLIAIDLYSLLEKTAIIMYAIISNILQLEASEDRYLFTQFSLRRLIDRLKGLMTDLPKRESREQSDATVSMALGCILCNITNLYDQISRLRHKTLRIHGNIVEVVDIKSILDILEKLSEEAEILFSLVTKDITAEEISTLLTEHMGEEEKNALLEIKFKDLLKFIPVKWEAIDPRVRRVLETHINESDDPSNYVLLAIAYGRKLWSNLYEGLLEELSKVE